MGDNNSYNDVPPPTQTSLPQNGEGQSTQRPPLFDGNNYNYWKRRIRIYLQSFNLEIWQIVESAYTHPHCTSRSMVHKREKVNANKCKSNECIILYLREK